MRQAVAELSSGTYCTYVPYVQRTVWRMYNFPQYRICVTPMLRTVRAGIQFLAGSSVSASSWVIIQRQPPKVYPIYTVEPEEIRRSKLLIVQRTGRLSWKFQYTVHLLQKKENVQGTSRCTRRELVRMHGSQLSKCSKVTNHALSALQFFVFFFNCEYYVSYTI